MNKTRIGIVGCGGIAKAHLAAYQKISDLQVQWVYDINPKAARAMADACGARVAGSVDELAAAGLDGVSVCSPPGVHQANCLPLVQRKIPVLCEKPLEADLPTARKLAALVQRRKSLFMVAFCHRFHGPIIELKKLVDAGTLGKPIFFRNLFGGYLDLTGNHRLIRKLSGGGCLIDHCVHSIDLFRYLVGEPNTACAAAGNVMQKVAIEDFGLIQLTTAKGAFGQIAASYSLAAAANTIEWYGSKGTAYVNYWVAGQPDLTYKLRGEDKPVVVDCSSHAVRFETEVAHFVDCIRNRRKPSITVSDGLATNRVVAALYQSIKTRRIVKIK